MYTHILSTLGWLYTYLIATLNLPYDNLWPAWGRDRRPSALHTEVRRQICIYVLRPLPPNSRHLNRKAETLKSGSMCYTTLSTTGRKFVVHLVKLCGAETPHSLHASLSELRQPSGTFIMATRPLPDCNPKPYMLITLLLPYNKP